MEVYHYHTVNIVKINSIHVTVCLSLSNSEGEEHRKAIAFIEASGWPLRETRH